MTTEWTLPVSPLIPQARLVVGVSGGADSTALLLLLTEQLKKPSAQLVVAHVNYGLRGRRSDRDELFVRELCRQKRVPLRVLKVRHFEGRVKRQKRSLQDLAREIRYSFFQKLVAKERAWGVAVAHHREDQAETVLDRFLRGSGARGLSGLKPLQTLILIPGKSLKIWRPLLRYSKEDLRSYLTSREAVWREDHSNQTLKYRRNQIRHQVLPFLSRWNPRFVEVLARMGEITSAEDHLLEQLLGPVEKKIKSRWKKDAYFCNGEAFQKIPLALQRRWVRHAAEGLTEKARGFSFERVEEIIRLWTGREKGPRDLGFGLSAGRTAQTAFFRKSRKKS